MGEFDLGALRPAAPRPRPPDDPAWLWSYNPRTKCWERGEGVDKREVRAFGPHLRDARTRG